MSSFLPTAQTALPLASASRTASATSLQPTTTSEATYWKKYRNPQFLAIPSNYPANDLSFATDNKYAVAAGPRVGVYSTKLGNVSDVLNENKKRVHDDFDDVDSDNEVEDVAAKKSQQTIRSISCPSVALCTAFRADNAMLLIGGQRGLLKIVANSSTKSTVRNFTGAAGTLDIRAVAWSRDATHVYVGSDDGSLRVFNIDTSECVVLKGHSDSIRCIVTNVRNRSNLIATASYDHSVRIWDVDTGECTHVVNHGFPVESVRLLPGNTMMVTVGNTRMKVWNVPTVENTDIHPLSTTIAHTKSITALTITRYSGGGANATEPVRIVTGGADGHVKIYDAVTLRVVHGWKYTSAITALKISPDKKTIVVGCSDGVVYIKSRDDTEATSVTAKKAKPRPGTYSYFMRGANEVVDESDYLVFVDQKKTLKAYDKHLKAFSYSKALDTALDTRNPKVICSVLAELGKRNGLVNAVSGRDSTELESLLSFAHRYISNQRYTPQLISLMDCIVTVYGPDLKRDPLLGDLVGKIRASVREELETQNQMGRLVGAIEGIICVAELAQLDN